MEKILDTDLQHYRFLSALELLPGGKQAVLVCSLSLIHISEPTRH